MATPTGRLTRGTILDQAQRRAGNTSTSLKAEMRVWLNQILDELYLGWDWPFLMTSTSVSLSGTTFALPAAFLRAQDAWGLVTTTVDGVAQRVRIPETDPGTYWARYREDTTASVPLLWTADRANDVGRVWPAPAGTVTATLRYKQWIANADTTNTTTYDADIPVFPWHSYLIERCYQQVLEWDENPKAELVFQKCEMMLARIRGTALPLHSIDSTLTLDPDTFVAPFRPEGE